MFSSRPNRTAEADETGGGDELPRTGHDIHFLSRLERVGYGESELALRLYRDRALVLGLLAERVIPEAADRVGIPLGEGNEVPHVVVARDGGFVTCLSARMFTADLPVIPFERVYVHLHRSDERRARMARADEVLDDQKATERLWGRLYHAGLALSREEFQQLAAITPLVLEALNEAMAEHRTMILRELAPAVGRLKRPRADLELLRLYWKSAHAVGHLMLLTSLGGRRDLERWTFQVGALSGFDEMHLRMAWLGDRTIALRALWAIGRAGKAALPCLKRALLRSHHLGAWGTRALGLLAIGFCHRRLRAEVEGALSLTRIPESMRELDYSTELVDRFQAAHHFMKLIENETTPEGRERRVRVAAGIGLDPDAREPLSYAADPLAPTRLAVTSFAFIDDDPVRGFGRMALSLAALAAQPAERFYLPAVDLAQATPFSPEGAVALASFAKPHDPVRVESKPARNGPCPCGSTKKYKKCCGAGA